MIEKKYTTIKMVVAVVAIAFSFNTAMAISFNESALSLNNAMHGIELVSFKHLPSDNPLCESDADGACDELESSGCTNPNACNYDLSATEDDGSCLTNDALNVCGGTCAADVDGDGICDDVDLCTDESTCNYADASNAACESLSCAGCTNPAGCNYDSTATISATCTNAYGCDTCSGETDGTGSVVDNDSDDDSVCDADEVVGCQDVAACNYMSAATDAGSCATNYYLDLDGDNYGAGTSICLISNPGVGYATVDGDLCPFNSTKAADLGQCGCAIELPEFDSDNDGVVDCIDGCPNNPKKSAPGTCGCEIMDSDRDGDGFMDCVDECPDNPSEQIEDTVCGCEGSVLDSDNDGTIDCIDNCPNCQSCSQVDLNSNGIGDACEIEGCMISQACNFNSAANVNDNSCILLDECMVCDTADADGDGITQEINEAFGVVCDCIGNTYDAQGVCNGSCTTDADQDGICDDDDDCQQIYLGEPCSNNFEDANYNANCPYKDVCGVCGGTGIPVADCDCSGNQSNNCGKCGAEDVDLNVFDCNGNCVDDPVDADTICEINEILGCMDATKCNYTSSANVAGQCYDYDDCGNCGGTMAFVDASSTPCTITYQDIDGATCTQGATGCFAIIPAGCSESSSGSCNCAGDMPAAGYDCSGACIDDPADADAICEVNEIHGCTNSAKCNYDSSANVDDSSCLDNDALGACGGTCFADLDGDGVCDRLNDGTEIDDCVGLIDACGVCNGSSAYYFEGTTTNCLPGSYSTASGDPCIYGTSGCLPCVILVLLDNSGNSVLPDYRDASERCHPDSTGCLDVASYSATDTISNACDCAGHIYDALGNCNGTCLLDADGDGTCDVDVNGQSLDPASGSSATASSCTEDTDGDGLCDVDDPCPLHVDNIQDVCGICHGGGIPAGYCNCGTMVVDSIGVCGGSCFTDIDQDDICDDVDSCIGVEDACSICNGPSTYLRNSAPCIPGRFLDANGNDCSVGDVGCFPCNINVYIDSSNDPCQVIYQDGNGGDCIPGTTGCNLIVPAGCTLEENVCDCNGNTYDAIGNCNGNCDTDNDNDGICDTDSAGNIVDDCDGTYDACMVCGGDGPDPDCGCNVVAEGFCDCNGNTYICGICGGDGPLPYRNCEGVCDNPTDDPSVCQEEIELVATNPTNTYVDSLSNHHNIDLDPRMVTLAIEELTARHSAMIESLDNASQTQRSLHATLDVGITSMGELSVLGESDLGNLVHVKGSMNIGDTLAPRSLFVSGSATIEGVTLAEGRVRSQFINLTSDLVSEGSGNLNGKLDITGNTILRSAVNLQDDLVISSTPSSPATFSISSSSGDITKSGTITARGTVTNEGHSNFQAISSTATSQIDTLQIDDTFALAGLAVVQNDFEVNSGGFRVDATSGGSYIAGNLTVQADSVIVDSLVSIQGDVDVYGTLFSRTGVETKSLTIDENLLAYGSGVFGNNIYVSSQSQLRNRLDLTGNLNIYQNNTLGIDIWRDSITQNVCTAEYLLIDGSVCTSGTLGCLASYGSDCVFESKGQFTSPTSFSVTASNGDIDAKGGVTATDATATFTANSSYAGQTVVASGDIQVTGEAYFDSIKVNQSGVSTFNMETNFPQGLSGGSLTINGSNGYLRVDNGLTEIGDLTVLETTTNIGSSSADAGNIVVYDGGSSNEPAPFSVLASGGSSFAAIFESTNTSNSRGGMEIKLNAVRPGGNYQYMTFANKNNHVVGRIEGILEEKVEDDVDPYGFDSRAIVREQQNANWDAEMAGIDLGISIGDQIISIGAQIAESSGTTWCMGIVFYGPFPAPFGCTAVPPPSMTAAAMAEVAINVAAMVTRVSGVAQSLYQKFVTDELVVDYEKVWKGHKLEDVVNVGFGHPNRWGTWPNWSTSLDNDHDDEVGVNYESGAGDYAEWLPKLNPKDEFDAGQIVGSKGGYISLDTRDCEKLFVISDRPIVIGGEVEEEFQANYDIAAFKGQVPVYVYGKVEFGDYIVASGNNDGIGIAVSKNKLKARHFENIVGVAWESSDRNRVVRINCAIGLNDLKNEALLALDARKQIVSHKLNHVTRLTHQLLTTPIDPEPVVAETKPGLIVVNDQTLQAEGDEIHVQQVTAVDVKEGFETAFEICEMNGVDTKNHPFWTQYQTNGQFKESWNQKLAREINSHNEWIVRLSAEWNDKEYMKLRYVRSVDDATDSNPIETSKQNRKSKTHRKMK